MSEIFVVLHNETYRPGGWLTGVYDSEEKAKEVLEKLRSDKKNDCYEYYYQKCELNTDKPSRLFE